MNQPVARLNKRHALIFDVFGYDTQLSDWNTLPKGQRGGVGDYFRETTTRRAICALVLR